MVPDCACSGQCHLPSPQPVQGEEGRRGSVWMPCVWSVVRWDSGIYSSCHVACHAGWWHGSRGGCVAHPEPLATEEYQHSGGGKWSHLSTQPRAVKRSAISAGEARGASAGPARTPPIRFVHHHLSGQIISLITSRECGHPLAAAWSWWVIVWEWGWEPHWPLVVVEMRKQQRYTHMAQQTMRLLCRSSAVSRIICLFNWNLSKCAVVSLWQGLCSLCCSGCYVLSALWSQVTIFLCVYNCCHTLDFYVMMGTVFQMIW